MIKSTVLAILLAAELAAQSAAGVNGRAIELVEWVLNVRLSRAERQMFERTPFDARTAAALSQMEQTIRALPPEQREAVRAQGETAFVKSLRANPTNEAKMLLAAYERIHSGEGPFTAIVHATSGFPAQLVGTWRHTTTSGVAFTNGAGGYSAPSGEGSTFTFSPNGEVRVDVMIQSSLYNCTTSVFITDRGRAEVNGSTLIVKTFGGDLDSKDNCSASGNYRKKTPPKEMTFQNWTVSRDQYGTKLCWGGSNDCYYKER